MCLLGWNTDILRDIRAYPNSLLRAIIARNHLTFFKIFSNVHFCPKFSNILPFFDLFKHFYPFSEKFHACTYCLE